MVIIFITKINFNYYFIYLKDLTAYVDEYALNKVKVQSHWTERNITSCLVMETYFLDSPAKRMLFTFTE